MSRHPVGERRGNEAGRAARRGQLAEILAVVEERYVALAGIGEALHVMDAQVRIGSGRQLRADLLGQCRDPDRRRSLEESGMLHPATMCRAIKLAPAKRR